MTLRQLKAAIDEAVGNLDLWNCPDAKVEVWFKKRMYRIDSIGQFQVVPDVTITIGPKELDLSE